jgi:hypothetical protein
MRPGAPSFSKTVDGPHAKRGQRRRATPRGCTISENVSKGRAFGTGCLQRGHPSTKVISCLPSPVSNSGGMPINQVFLLGTNMENAIHLPSGDQRASATFSVACVTCVAGPSMSIQRTKICVPRGSPSAR